MYSVLILAGPSAAGKTTVAEELIKREGSKFELVRSLTTRKKRGDGFDGEYLYAEREEFESRIASGGVLEYTEYAGELYGTPSSEIERISAEGRIPLLILDLKGVGSLSLRNDILAPCPIYVFSDLEVLEKRLADRYLGEPLSEENERRYNKRMAQNRSDLGKISEWSEDFYAFVENSGALSDAADKVSLLFSAFLSGIPKNESEINRTVNRIKSSIII